MSARDRKSKLHFHENNYSTSGPPQCLQLYYYSRHYRMIRSLLGLWSWEHRDRVHAFTLFWLTDEVISWLVTPAIPLRWLHANDKNWRSLYVFSIISLFFSEGMKTFFSLLMLRPWEHFTCKRHFLRRQHLVFQIRVLRELTLKLWRLWMNMFTHLTWWNHNYDDTDDYKDKKKTDNEINISIRDINKNIDSSEKKRKRTLS